jgi:hypothetical protein
MPVVPVHIHLPGIRQSPVSVNFLVDTGNTDSCLHPRDARGRLQVEPALLASPESWPSVRVSHGIGGTSLSFVHPAIYTFLYDDGRLQQIESNIDIAHPTPANERFPSLLGWDILRFFRIELDYVGLQVTLR